MNARMASRLVHRVLTYSPASCASSVWSRALSRRVQTRRHPTQQFTRTFTAFAFDIDGVLIRGSKTIDAARRALSILEGDNPQRVKIPYILLTNGGGSSEEARCQKLSSQLGYEIQPAQFVQSHTVLKSVVHEYADQPVLILGGKDNEIREVAENYGFKHVYTPLDIFAWNPSIWPFYEMTPCQEETVKHANFAETPIAAVFVFHDPRNWALDIQILCDVIMSGGVPGRAFNSRIDPNDPPVKLIFCNPDLLWKSDYDRPRLGQGAFKTAFQAVFKGVTGTEYSSLQYGKPTKATYMFAERVLRDHYHKLHRSSLDPSSIYMVGDNPESDIAGANAAGWSSILVRTGVYDPRRGAPTHKPTHEAEDVEEAVKWAIQREIDRQNL